MLQALLNLKMLTGWMCINFVVISLIILIKVACLITMLKSVRKVIVMSQCVAHGYRFPRNSNWLNIPST